MTSSVSYTDTSIRCLTIAKKGQTPDTAIPMPLCGAFGLFFTQSPSFLDYQRTLQQSKGQNNVHTLLGVAADSL